MPSPARRHEPGIVLAVTSHEDEDSLVVAERDDQLDERLSRELDIFSFAARASTESGAVSTSTGSGTTSTCKRLQEKGRKSLRRP
jgi:hypothetical protein